MPQAVILDAAAKATLALIQMRAIKARPAQTQLEIRTARALRQRFTKVKADVLKALDDLGHVPENGKQVTQPLIAAIPDLQGIVKVQTKQATAFGRARAKDMVKRLKKGQPAMKSVAVKEAKPGFSGSYTKTTLETPPAWAAAENKIIDKAISSTDKTWHRMTTDITQSLAYSYEQKATLDEAKEDLATVLTGMQDYELDRTARTIINGAQNAACSDTIRELGLDYTQWWTCEDDRVRGVNPNDEADHLFMHGQIIPVGGTFSNGLQYPGDQNGDISEWINCRCSTIPFLMPAGLAAPEGEDYFYESDLVVAEEKPEPEPPQPAETPQEATPAPQPEQSIIEKAIPMGKNIKEVEQIAREYGICDSVDFKGIPLDAANEFNRVVYGYNEIAPKALEKLDSYGTMQHIYKTFDTEYHMKFLEDLLKQNPKLTREVAERYYKLKVTRAEPNVIAARIRNPAINKVGLGLNKNVVKGEMSTINSMLDAMVNSGHSPIGCNTVKSLTDHEMAHMIGYAYDMHDTKYLTDPVLKGIYDKLTNDEIIKGLSKYATKNGKEFIAESWAEYQNNPSCRPIAKQVGERMEQIISNYHITNP